MSKSKIILIIVGLLLTVIIAFFAYKEIISRTPGDELPFQNEVSYMNNEVDFNLMVYGEKIVFPENMKYSNISSLDDSIFKDNDFVYIIINDINGETEFTKEDFEKLVNYANHNDNFNFYYIGSEKLSIIKENISDCNVDKEDLSFGYIMYAGNRLQHYGVWSKNDEKNSIVDKQLGENICEAIYSAIKSNE